MSSSQRIRREINKGPMVFCNRTGVYYHKTLMEPDLEKGSGYVLKKMGTLLPDDRDNGVKQGPGWIRP